MAFAFPNIHQLTRGRPTSSCFTLSELKTCPLAATEYWVRTQHFNLVGQNQTTFTIWKLGFELELSGREQQA